MTQSIRAFLVVALVACITPLFAFAQDTTYIETLLQGTLRVLNIIVTILFVLAIAVFAWGIVKLISFADNPEKRKNAKAILWWGVIGIAVLSLLMGLVAILKTVFGVPDAGSPSVPSFGGGGGGGGGISLPSDCSPSC